MRFFFQIQKKNKIQKALISARLQFQFLIATTKNHYDSKETPF